MKTLHPIERVKQVYDLREKGYQNRAAARNVGVPESTASRYYHEYLEYLEYEKMYKDDPDHVFHLDISKKAVDALIKAGKTSIKDLKNVQKRTFKKLKISDEEIEEIKKTAAMMSSESYTESPEVNVNSEDTYRQLTFDDILKDNEDSKSIDSQSEDEGDNRAPKTPKELLTPTQKSVKQARPVDYYHASAGNRYVTFEQGRDILHLYMFGFGYAPIRQLLGLKDDKKVENDVRHHMLGRNEHTTLVIDGVEYEFYGELNCPSPKGNKIPDFVYPYLQDVIERYGTGDDEYVKRMMLTGVWWDESPDESKARPKTKNPIKIKGVK